MTQKFYVGPDGHYIGSFDGVEPPVGSIEVPIAPEDARQVWSGSAWTVTPAILLANAELARWRTEVGGITVGGVRIATDDRSKLLIAGARMAADADPGNWSTVWQTGSGGVPLNAAAMIAISNAVQAHVNACFLKFSEVANDIAADVITDTEAIDAAFASIVTSY